MSIEHVKATRNISGRPQGWLAAVAVVLLWAGPTPQSWARELPDFTVIAERNGPAVVNISTTQKVAQKNPSKPHGMPMPPEGMPKGAPFDDFFRRFFDERERGNNEDAPAPEPGAHSLGSGFIVSADGYVLTNHHVIKDAEEIVVRLSDRRELVAKLVGSDPRSDVAVLKLEATDLPVIKVGKSDRLKVGEWVLAIGSPFDFDHTVTAGIVSAVGRNLPSENYVPFIQTDVAINPGNSGGPLINMDGDVVGINSQIYSRTGGFMGLSFAIPIDLAMNVVDQLKSSGHVTRGWLGIIIQDVTRELAESFGLKKPAGALVSRVLPDSPALKGGLQAGDVVLEFNGREVPDSGSLPPLVGVTKVGGKVAVKVMRNSKPLELSVVLGELPQEDAQNNADEDKAPASADGYTDKRLALSAKDLTAEQRKSLEDKGGVSITSVKDGPALKAGLRSGDVVLMMNGAAVQDLAHFRRLAAELPVGKPIPVLVYRRDGPTWLVFKIVEEKKK